MDLELKADNNGISFPVKVVPRASRNAITEVREGALVVRLCAPPVEGKANAALIDYLAEFFGLRKKQITIKVGEKSRRKIVTLGGLDAPTLTKALQQVIK